MRRMMMMTVFLLLAPLTAGAGEYCEAGMTCREAVERIETAYRVAREKAATPEETVTSLKFRNGGLWAMVEITYEAALAWLADRAELAEQLEDEQGLWQTMMENRRNDTPEEMEETSRLLLARLEVFERIIASEFLKESK